MQKATRPTEAIPRGMNLDDIEIQRKLMNKIMMKFVEQVRMEPSMYIRDRTWYERLLNMAPVKDLN